MGQYSQKDAPIFEALERFRKMRVVPFDVPGHKRGRGNPWDFPYGRMKSTGRCREPGL